MNNREQIQHLEKDLEKVEGVLAESWLSIGSTWFDDKNVDRVLDGIEKPKASRDALKAAIAEARNLLAEKEALLASRSEVQEKIADAAQLQSVIGDSQKQLAATEQRAMDIFPSVGQAAWETFASNSDKLGEFSSLFADMTELSGKLLEIERKRDEDAENPDRPKGFQLLIRRGMAIADQLKYNGMLKRLQNEQAKIGKALLETNFVDKARNPQLLEAAAPAIKELELKAKLEAEISAARAELSDTQAFLSEQKKNYRVSNPEKILSQLDGLASDKLAAKDRSLTRFGKTAWQIQSLVEHGDLGGVADSIAKLSEQKEEIQAAIARHRAALEFIDAEKRLAQIDRETAALDRAILQRQRELGVLGEERGHLEKKRDKLRQEAGEAISEQAPS